MKPLFVAWYCSITMSDNPESVTWCTQHFGWGIQHLWWNGKNALHPNNINTPTSAFAQRKSFVFSSYGRFFLFHSPFTSFASCHCWCLFLFRSSIGVGACSSVLVVVVVGGCWSFVFFTSSVLLLVRWVMKCFVKVTFHIYVHQTLQHGIHNIPCIMMWL